MEAVEADQQTLIIAAPVLATGPGGSLNLYAHNNHLDIKYTC